jgi:hypothetical protein
MASGGFTSIVSYVVFIIYIFIENIHDGRVSDHIGDMKYFTGDVASIAGSFALAFMVFYKIYIMI